MKHRFLLLAALPLTLFAAEPPMPPMPPAHHMASMPAAPASKHVMYDAAQLQWGDAPPALPKGAQLAVLSGDPGSAGPYVIRLKAPPGYKIALHWHPTDEHVTVLEGDLTLRMGDGADAHAHTFGADGYALLPARMHHGASTQGGATLQIEGMGPFQINYVDPKDDPRAQASSGRKAGKKADKKSDKKAGR